MVRVYSSLMACGWILFKSNTVISLLPAARWRRDVASLPRLNLVARVRELRLLRFRLRRLRHGSVRTDAHRVEARHQVAQTRAHLLDLVVLLALALRVEPRASILVFVDPLTRVVALLDVGD